MKTTSRAKLDTGVACHAPLWGLQCPALAAVVPGVCCHAAGKNCAAAAGLCRNVTHRPGSTRLHRLCGERPHRATILSAACTLSPCTCPCHLSWGGLPVSVHSLGALCSTICCRVLFSPSLNVSAPTPPVDGEHAAVQLVHVSRRHRPSCLYTLSSAAIGPAQSPARDGPPLFRIAYSSTPVITTETIAVVAYDLQRIARRLHTLR